VQQRDDRTELFIYRRNAAALQRIPLDPLASLGRSVLMAQAGCLQYR